MDKNKFQSTWYYRLLRVIFYFLYLGSLLVTIGIIGIIITGLFGFDTGIYWASEDLMYGFLWLFLIPIFFTGVKSLFYYICFGVLIFQIMPPFKK